MALDILKGRECMVWTFMGNTRMYTALKNYGDRLSQIGLFSFKVDATGTITETGVAISDMLTSSSGPFATSTGRLKSAATTLASERTRMEESEAAYRNRITKQFAVMNKQVSAFKATQSYMQQQIDLWTNKNNN